MAKFITIGYGSREGYDRTDPAVRNAAHAHDARLREMGVLMGIAPALRTSANDRSGSSPLIARSMPAGRRRASIIGHYSMPGVAN
jgi:hypothetical protein